MKTVVWTWEIEVVSGSDMAWGNGQTVADAAAPEANIRDGVAKDLMKRNGMRGGRVTRWQAKRN